MKLVRASCPCGFRTRKVRSGYHYYRWWFPVYQSDDGTLVDVTASLPKDQRERIDQYQLDLYHRTPSDDKAARREASAQMRAFADRVRDDFIDRITSELRQQHDVKEHDFDPVVGTTFSCPSCNQRTLKLDFANVKAYCKTGCEHVYDWLDSEMSGCPKCAHRPHRFKTECESEFSVEARTIAYCSCSSSTDCVSHHDGYCPKCGDLPNTYSVDSVTYCGKHHELLIDYHCPANFLFIETHSRWVAHQFPNAKIWGDAGPDSDGSPDTYCASCESDHQRWLANQPSD